MISWAARHTPLRSPVRLRRRTKRGNEEGDQQDFRKRNRLAKHDCRYLVASSDAGSIIGRGGHTIQSLRGKHKTIIQVPDCDGPERILTISGETDAVLDALKDVLPIMAENQRARKDQCELRALIHQSQAGAVIGKGGDRVKELRWVIEVYSILDQTPIRGPLRLYDPFTYDGYNVEEYGAAGSRARQEYEGDSRGGNYNQQSHYSGNNVNEQGNYGGGYSNMASGSQNQGSDREPMTTQVTLSNDLCGAIIGPRGTRISQIRQQSGAGIRIDDPLETNDRIITINGTKQQITHAQYLLQMAVKQSGLYNG
ncbi:unnamed protein product [Didymodactylos carnosus]|uniref:K Homology domain-containing protein n=1 Tax=Didymodactylos carnosus TaxID=1234261 RepID=A0A815B3V7_9BILA|nr:unnamed protein product [Didymodactylos carnosus]CAF1266899.1 unnamed protein product [Didymodactylos carnosus]CAF3751679.1 unnamed protein product [Didymodactylos carnosus]CAF4050812.1 unnamed protein product [Didymodactylos carnosus]